MDDVGEVVKDIIKETWSVGREGEFVCNVASSKALPHPLSKSGVECI